MTRSSSLPDAWGEDVAPDKGLTVYEFLRSDPATEFSGKKKKTCMAGCVSVSVPS